MWALIVNKVEKYLKNIMQLCQICVWIEFFLFIRSIVSVKFTGYIRNTFRLNTIPPINEKKLEFQ